MMRSMSLLTAKVTKTAADARSGPCNKGRGTLSATTCSQGLHRGEHDRLLAQPTFDASRLLLLGGCTPVNTPACIKAESVLCTK